MPSWHQRGTRNASIRKPSSISIDSILPGASYLKWSGIEVVECRSSSNGVSLTVSSIARGPSCTLIGQYLAAKDPQVGGPVGYRTGEVLSKVILPAQSMEPSTAREFVGPPASYMSHN